MSIGFSADRWEAVKESHARWWSGELERPVVQLTVSSRDPGRPEPDLPFYGFTAFYDLSVSAEAIVDRWDYELSCQHYFGDAFPCVLPNFGPGVAAAFLGCNLEQGNGTVWFHPAERKDIADLHFEYDPDNIWLNRIKDICRAAVDRWQGSVQVSMTDIGGPIDIISSFRPGTELLLDLYDHPDEVKRLTWEVHELWWKYFEEINAILAPVNPGYTAWASILSPTPTYMLQCDFCYMIGPEMFDEFVTPELVASCKRLGNAFYHLDGPGELPHLDSLLGIQELNGIQWVPGSGAPDFDQWPEVYRKIHSAGKLIQTFYQPYILNAIVDQIGTGKGIVHLGCAKDEAEARECLHKYGFE